MVLKQEEKPMCKLFFFEILISIFIFINLSFCFLSLFYILFVFLSSNYSDCGGGSCQRCEDGKKGTSSNDCMSGYLDTTSKNCASCNDVRLFKISFISFLKVFFIIFFLLF